MNERTDRQTYRQRDKNFKVLGELFTVANLHCQLS